MAYSIEQIEDAIISALEPLKANLGVRTIKSYQGELETEKDIAMIRIYPAIFVVYGGSEYMEHGSRKIEKMRYDLFFCDISLRSETEARRGSAQNPGTYAMMQATRDILYGESLFLEIFPFHLIRQEPVWFGKGISIYAAEYETAQTHLY